MDEDDEAETLTARLERLAQRRRQRRPPQRDDSASGSEDDGSPYEGSAAQPRHSAVQALKNMLVARVPELEQISGGNHGSACPEASVPSDGAPEVGAGWPSAASDKEEAGSVASRPAVEGSPTEATSTDGSEPDASMPDTARRLVALHSRMDRENAWAAGQLRAEELLHGEDALHQAEVGQKQSSVRATNAAAGPGLCLDLPACPLASLQAQRAELDALLARQAAAAAARERLRQERAEELRCIQLAYARQHMAACEHLGC